MLHPNPDRQGGAECSIRTPTVREGREAQAGSHVLNECASAQLRLSGAEFLRCESPGNDPQTPLDQSNSSMNELQSPRNDPQTPLGESNSSMHELKSPGNDPSVEMRQPKS